LAVLITCGFSMWLVNYLAGYNLSIIKVGVRVRGFYGYLFTSRLVKTILIRAFPKIASLFEPTKGPTPKAIHVTPLYEVTSRGVECIYSDAICKQRGMVKCTGAPRMINLDGDYFFYLGFHESIVRSVEVVSSLLNYGECFEFIKQNVCVEVNSIDLFNVERLSRELVEKSMSSRGVKVTFSSPTLLRDPLRTRRKHKTFLPSPINVFAAPIYVKLFVSGAFRTGVFRRELLRVHRLFSETYSALKTARVKWIYYSDKPIPALVGFVNYRLNEEYLKFLESRGVDVAKWLEELFAYTITMGIGAGRAAGFGHVELKPLHSSKAT
jgi:CRISPR/Cas system endoribonuclease Cas6 (RAMP superfamily)